MTKKFLLIIFLLTLLLLRFIQKQPVYSDGDIIRISGRVSSEPIRYTNSQYLSLQGLSFYLSDYPLIGYSDEIVVEGVVQKNYGFFAKDKLINPRLIYKKDSDFFVFNIRKKLLEFYKNSLPEPHASLVSGMTIGSKSQIPRKFWENLKKTGTAHVVVASGMNVTLVAGFLLNIFLIFMKRRKAVVFTLFGIWFYALVSGFDAPIIRASIMGSLVFAAQGLGRLNLAWRGLFLSAILMLFLNPLYLSDLGFILSFLATASILIFNSVIYKSIYFVPKILREDVSVSLSAQIGVAPILFAVFGQFNILSPLINAIIAWTVAPITIIGMVAGMVGVFLPNLGSWILYLSYPLTSFFVWVISTFK